MKIANIRGIFINIKHSTQDLHTVAQLILACIYTGVSPIVRAPNKDPGNIARILDVGAAAVVVPHVDSVAEVRSLVYAAKYACLGDRGYINNQPVLNLDRSRLIHTTVSRRGNCR